jgi:glycosyltransferase involved in cell wall biosynthesis
LKVALVHDYISEYGGAERVLEALCEMFPEAPIYTAFAVSGSTAWKRFCKRKIVEWKYAALIKQGKLYSPLRFLAPFIWQSFDFSGFDLVISSASWYITKGIITHPGTTHICYCHTPPRYLYGYKTAVEWQKYLPVRIYAKIVNNFLRRYDFLAAQKPNYFIANSKNVKKRIKKFYDRTATVIYPPVEVSEIKKATANLRPKDYFLVVSRVVGAKGIDLAIEASNKMGFCLKIVGEPAGLRWEEKKFKKLCGKQVEFVGRVSDKALWRLYGECKAFLALATDEDFGITPVEAMAAGRPVIAYRGGGYLETVVSGKTGLFFDKLTVDGLVKAIRKFDDSYHQILTPKACRLQAGKFSKERFVREIKKFCREKNKNE